MGNKTNSGFTIIETMLFLAVSGALMVAILIGAGASINQERYRDSVNSLKSYIQDQYSNTTNSINSRTGNESCSAGAVVNSGTAQYRGTSECLMVGRLIKVDASGIKLTSADVLAYPNPVMDDSLATDLLDLRTNYTLARSTIGRDTYELPWDAQVVKHDNPDANMPFTILIVRMPRSGAITTFTSASSSISPNGIVTVANNTTPLLLCVGGESSSFTGDRLGVRIGARASNQGAVQVPLGSEGVCKK